LINSANVFAYLRTFEGERLQQSIVELQRIGITGVNVALNYHAGRDFFLRGGPEFGYLKEGFHYYRPDMTKYSEISLKPTTEMHLNSNKSLETLIIAGETSDFEINAWAVFFHNGALGAINPSATVMNCYGNNFLSDLCPSNPSVQNYAYGLTSDLCSRGISNILLESVRFHGAVHGEHHERFFLKMSPITEFLLYLCFCDYCVNNANSSGIDAESLRQRVENSLSGFLNNEDEWMGLDLTKDNLVSILGDQILPYLEVRSGTLVNIFRRIQEIAHSLDVKTKFLDPSALIGPSHKLPAENSWIAGHDLTEISKHVDFFQPIFFEEKSLSFAAHYRSIVSARLSGAVSPMFPFNSSEQMLSEKIFTLREFGIEDFDFYLLDTMRQRDLDWISAALS